ncbi:SGNH/GDSL hydrolase family protein [Burkholderia multivorans]|nr:SGNH/GDSL hydrolase family protein [Burkholderia multivorans]
MRINSIVASTVLACTIAACGGGGDGQPTVLQQKSPPVTTNTPRAIIIDEQGDSTMLGAEKIGDGYRQAPDNEPATVQAILRTRLGPQISVHNNGVSGALISQRLNGTAPYNAPYAPGDAQIVVGNWALNEAFNPNIETPEQFRQFLVQFVNEVRAAGKIAILEEPNPSTETMSLGSYVAAIDSVAIEMNVPLVKQYDYILSLPNWQSMLSDGTHPTNELYKIKAQRQADVLEPIVRSLQ